MSETKLTADDIETLQSLAAGATSADLLISAIADKTVLCASDDWLGFVSTEPYESFRAVRQMLACFILLSEDTPFDFE
jgi:hypothetical protein